MQNTTRLIATSLITLTIFNSTPILNAHNHNGDPLAFKPVLADLKLLQAANIPVLYKDEETGVGYAVLNSAAENKLSELAHAKGRCGNFEALDEIPRDLIMVREQMQALNTYHKRNQVLSFSQVADLEVRSEIADALELLSADKIRGGVEFLSSFPTRYNRGTNPNNHINPFMDRLTEITKQANYPITIETISHKSTPQKSIKLTIQGFNRPSEIIVLGGHLDSISGFMGFGGKAPGADDNASGSSALVEALRVLTLQPQPERTIEFYWYAGEESGLLGSAEIAEAAKVAKKDIIAVLQLDMTMFPGDGVLKIASMTDFTSRWLRDYLVAANNTYFHAIIQEDQCGYGCSDHASWYRRGFPTLFPTESKFDSSFKSIHTVKDVISPVMSFEHAKLFSKIALTMAMDLGNSEQRQPY
ncbi:MAG: M20/M25/M40 family metallo-hydrolase [Bdellovibrionota bacterium]